VIGLERVVIGLGTFRNRFDTVINCVRTVLACFVIVLDMCIDRFTNVLKNYPSYLTTPYPTTLPPHPAILSFTYVNIGVFTYNYSVVNN